MIPKNTSTRLSQDPEVGVKCRVIRGFLANQMVDVVVLVGVVVVEHNVQPAARAGLGDEIEEVQEFGLAVAVITAVGHRARRDLQRGEQGGRAVALVVVGGLLSLGRVGPTGRIVWVGSGSV
jgi:hypothetical protein